MISDMTRPAILAVDDDPGNLAVLGNLLKPHYDVLAAPSGARALEIATGVHKPDLILLDVLMPEMDGYAVLKRLRDAAATRDIPVIFVTGLDSTGDEEKGLELGAVDYIAKPYRPAIVLARVHTQLELKRTRDRLARQNLELEAKVTERTRMLALALDQVEATNANLRKNHFDMLLAISNLIGLRGNFLGEHSRRVADLSRQLAQRMGMAETEQQEVFVAALLHDIGKIGSPDGLLSKPVFSMNSDEQQRYRQHPVLAADTLKHIDSLKHVADIIRSHHEHFDGSGFPEGRSGLEIPVGACIVAAVSDYDDLRMGVLTTQRMTAKQACQYLLEQRGRRYAASVIDHLEPLLAAQMNFEIDEIRVTTRHLQEGMLLSRDIHPDGYLLLSKNTLITRNVINQLVEVEKTLAVPLEIFVVRERQGL